MNDTNQPILGWNDYKLSKKEKNKSTKIKSHEALKEKQWVDNIVEDFNVFDLAAYVHQFEYLNKYHVMNCLDDTLKYGSLNKQTIALTLIQSLIKGESSDDVINYFNLFPKNIQAAQYSVSPQLRRKADAIMKFLDIHDKE